MTNYELTDSLHDERTALARRIAFFSLLAALVILLAWNAAQPVLQTLQAVGGSLPSGS
jgi:hypothetical protein